MKAVRIHGHGGIDQLRYEDAPDPQVASSEEAIVNVKAASVNRLDISTRRGLTGAELSLPHILGGDGSGVVTEVGRLAKNVKTGDAVCLYPPIGCGRCEFCISEREFMCIQLHVLGERENGTYAEYVRVPARNCFPIPAALSFEEAAAFPLVYLTLWRMLVTNANLKPGEHILIVGVSGGIGSAALQVAAHMGTHVFVTSSSDAKIARAKELGARYGINHNKADFAKEVRQLTAKRGVDVAVDCVGGETWMKSLACLARGGRLVTCGAIAGANPQTDIRRIFWNHLKVFGSGLGSRAEFRQVLNFMQFSGTKPVIDQIFHLRDAAAAQTRMEEGKQFGKIVLRMDG